jgi:hypothetical protein
MWERLQPRIEVANQPDKASCTARCAWVMAEFVFDAAPASELAIVILP